MPIRKDRDFQRTPIRSWDSWVDEAIEKAQEEGQFDNLPDQGKPIKIEDAPFAPDMASALRTLKNAGYAPTWMEIDREITQGKEEMQLFLDRSVAYLNARIAELAESAPEPVRLVRPGRWQRLKRWFMVGAGPVRPEPRPLGFEDLIRIRDRMRQQYLERAAVVDKKVTQFHAALPRNLWHLERMRITPEQSARAFDRVCPPLLQAPDQGHAPVDA